MKTINLIIAIVLISTLSFASKEQVLKSKVKNVTLFLSTAQVYRTASFNIEAGVTELIFEGVSPYLNTNSLQAKGNGNYIILDVQYRIKQPEPVSPVDAPLPPKIQRDIKILEDSLSFLDFDIQDWINKKDVLEYEKKILLQNKLMQGNIDTIPELKEAMTYLRKQLNDINVELNIVNRENYKLAKVRNGIEERLTKLRNYNAHVNPVKIEEPKHQVVVSVQADAATSGNMTINYLVNNAGWAPDYDLRVSGTDKPVTLVCKANVYQNSGEDWEEVKLKLSTIQPNISNVKPNLAILYLNYYTAVTYSRKDNSRGSGAAYPASLAKSEASYYAMDDEYSPALTSADYTYAQQTMTNVEYDIKLPYTIKSDGKSHKVAIKNHDLPAEYYHYIVPKLDKQAYLIAKVTDYNTLDLLPGQATIYFDGTYVGKTSINTNMMQDTMELALGTDRGLIVERKKDTDSEEMKYELLGNNVVKKVSYTIKVKNNKPITSHIIIEDQIPLSSDEEIKVKALKTAEAEYVEETGMLKWKFDLASSLTKNLKFSYSIEYNKNKQLANIF